MPENLREAFQLKLQELANVVMKQEELATKNEELLKNEINRLKLKIEEKEEEFGEKDFLLVELRAELDDKNKFIEEEDSRFGVLQAELEAKKMAVHQKERVLNELRAEIGHKDLMLAEFQRKFDESTEKYDNDIDEMLKMQEKANMDLLTMQEQLAEAEKQTFKKETTIRKMKIAIKHEQNEWEIAEHNIQREIKNLTDYIDELHEILEENGLIVREPASPVRKRTLSPIMEVDETGDMTENVTSSLVDENTQNENMSNDTKPTNVTDVENADGKNEQKSGKKKKKKLTKNKKVHYSTFMLLASY